MSGLFIPDDYDPEAGTIIVLAEVPNSVLWLASFSGAVSALASEFRWDKATGDRTAAAEIGQEIFDSLTTEIDGGGA